MITRFRYYLEQEGKSQHTVNHYSSYVEEFLEWYSQTFGSKFERLIRQNVLEYRSFLQTVKRNGDKTVNVKLAALAKFNEFLISKNLQKEIVITKNDFTKIQQPVASPATINQAEVESFRQKVLINEGSRNHAIVTIMAYAGLRISETLNLRLDKINMTSREIIVKGKGNKHRIVFMGDKVHSALSEYLKERESEESDYLFVSRRGGKIDNSVINRVFNKYSDEITPHTLRHFFCSHALENDFSIHEVANQAGHSNIHTTLLYTNPSMEQMKEKMNRL